MFSLPQIDAKIPILIAGATGTGKSALALKIANSQGRTIVNADALQVYDCWRVLTARPSEADEAEAEHLLYGHVDCDTPYSVGAWLGEVADILAAKTDPAPIIIGGTGLYFSCLTEGLVDIPAIPSEVRQRSEQILTEGGLEDLLAKLDQVDPDSASKLDRQNPKRVQRAWEVFEATGRGIRAWQSGGKAALLPLESCRGFVLDAPRDWLIPRLEKRFDIMWDNGALDEVAQNAQTLDPTSPAAQAIGAPEIARYLRGDLSRDDAIEAANIATRQYAKRQRSWFRNRLKSWTFLELSR